MTEPTVGRGPDVEELFALFPPAADLPEYAYVPAAEVPPPYDHLLVHEHHMTVTVEAHHGDLVDVRVLDARRNDDTYARKILLTLQKTGRVVQFGIVRVRLQYCASQVRDEILAERTPLGRVLIRHNVLRRIEPTRFFRVFPGPAMATWFGRGMERTTYGRLGIIHCDGQPAVEVLEIVAPE